MPTMAASTGSFSVSGVMRALEPCTINTISPWPAPTVSTTTNVRPVLTRRSRCAGSTRSGSTVSSLRPVIDATFWVATTLPVTLARNMGPSLARGQQVPGLPGDDQFLVGRHDPKLHPATAAVNRHLAFRRIISERVEVDAEPVQVGTDRRADRRRVFADAAREHDGVGPVQQEQVRPEVMPDRRDK